MAWDPEFEAAFNPRAVAVVGASREPQILDFVANLQRSGFMGRIYPINVRAAGEEIHGLKVYPNLISVPKPIDLVIISVPAHAVPAVLEDCIAANARNIEIFTAGFSELGEERGINLEKQLQEIAQRGGLRILGPNCMGLHIPAARLTVWETLTPESGPVAFLSQSGGHAGQFVRNASRFGIYFSKVISYGNAAGFDSIDLLEYLATDPETGIIDMYLEGVRDGRKLTTMAREINKTKPVLVWKGGLTECGARAVASHTGSLGGQYEVWDAFYKQTGAVRIDGMEELIDVTMAFLHLSPLTQGRIALMGIGGGNTVAGADVCAREGLELPALAQETQRELAGFIPREGTIIKNPLDLGVVLRDVNILLRSLEPVAADPLIDAIIFALDMGLLIAGDAADSLAARGQQVSPDALHGAVEGQTQAVLETLIGFTHKNVHCKPLIVVLQPGMGHISSGQQEWLQQELIKAGIPVFSSLERASRALGKFVKYYKFLEKLS